MAGKEIFKQALNMITSEVIILRSVENPYFILDPDLKNKIGIKFKAEESFDEKSNMNFCHVLIDNKVYFLPECFIEDFNIVQK